MDNRIVQLAKNLVNYSCNLQNGEKVLIESRGTDALPLVRAIIKEVYKVGAMPFVEITNNTVQRELLMGMSSEQAQFIADIDSKKMQGMDAYIGITSNLNVNELSDVPNEKMKIYSSIYGKQVHHDIRLTKKWVVLQYPTTSMAQSAGKSLEAFEDFYYQVCNLDYSKMSKAMDNLVNLMNNTDKVRITAPNTDLSFSIKDIPAIKCAGEMNIPDGEVYSAPVRDSINGYISYNTPSLYEGFTYENVRLEFENGKIINATANDTTRINKVFDTDDGARYVGEFAIGVNPYILNPMNNILFDEKIMGSIHFTPGSCYDDAYNGNVSSIHWDLVLIQTEAFGGGEIYFDDILIRKDGVFLIDELLCLNPENLI